MFFAFEDVNNQAPETVEAGFKGLHFQVVHWGERIYGWLNDDDVNKGVNAYELYDYLGVDSVTSYLQPDDLYGYGYLEAIKEVFNEK